MQIGSLHSATLRQIGTDRGAPTDRTAAAKALTAERGRTRDEASNPDELSTEEEHEVRELQQRDHEVRAHENAHSAAAGDLASGGPTYDFKRGPDGKQYAVAGEVRIQLEVGRTPEETLNKMRQAMRAANAPADPSGQDRQVAARAMAKADEAQREITAAKRGGDESTAGPRLDLLV